MEEEQRDASRTIRSSPSEYGSKTPRIRKGRVDPDRELPSVSLAEYVGDGAEWRAHLRAAARAGKNVGVSEQEVEALATQMGNLLAERVCPATAEE